MRTGPPWTLNGKTILYHIPSAREWLKSQQVVPVRARRGARS
jgi:hypothetical protein